MLKIILYKNVQNLKMWPADLYIIGYCYVIRLELLSELTNIKLLWSTVTTTRVDNAGTAGGADNAGRVLLSTEARLEFISARDKLGQDIALPRF